MNNDVDNQEIKELLIGLTQQVGGLTQEFQTLNTRVGRLEEHYYALDKKMDVQFATLDKKIDVQFATLDKKIEVQREELKGEISRLSEKIDGMVKRVDNQEILSRGATLALIAGGITTLVRFLVFPQP